MTKEKKKTMTTKNGDSSRFVGMIVEKGRGKESQASEDSTGNKGIRKAKVGDART